MWRLRIHPTTGQLLLDLYALGPAGWTLAAGGARHVVNLLNTQHPTLSRSTTPIAVIGHGVAGLFMLRALHAAGWSCLTCFYDSSEDLTSHNAGGFLAPPDIPHASAQDEATFSAIALDSYHQMAAVANASPTAIVRSARFVDSYTHLYSLEENLHGLRVYVDAGLMRREEVLLDFSTAAPLHPAQVYSPNVFMEAMNLMVELRAEADANGVTFVQRHINDVAELASDFPVVAVCAGHDSGRLAGDGRCHPVVGHTIRLKGQDASQLRYTISKYSEPVLVNGIRYKRATYVHCAPDRAGVGAEVGIAGGTFIDGEIGEEAIEAEYELMIARLRHIFYGPNAISWP